jgi:hypothetical protein
MSILNFSKERYRELQRELAMLNLELENPLIQIDSACKLVDDAMSELKDYLIQYKFQSDEEEIEFYKDYMTDFLKDAVFYTEVFNLESIKKVGTKKSMRQYYEQELRSIQNYLDSHQTLYNYLLLENTDKDRTYFLRSSEAPVYKPSLFRHTLDTRFCPVFTLYFGRIKGVLEISKHIYSQLRKLNGNLTLGHSAKRPQLNWTGKKVDLVELVYALKVSGVINHGRAEIREISRVFETLFGMNFQDIYRTYTEISIRKKSRTAFLDFLTERLEDHLEQGEAMH